jgi:hypothetical protein
MSSLGGATYDMPYIQAIGEQFRDASSQGKRQVWERCLLLGLRELTHTGGPLASDAKYAHSRLCLRRKVPTGTRQAA